VPAGLRQDARDIKRVTFAKQATGAQQDADSASDRAASAWRACWFAPPAHRAGTRTNGSADHERSEEGHCVEMGNAQDGFLVFFFAKDRQKRFTHELGARGAMASVEALRALLESRWQHTRARTTASLPPDYAGSTRAGARL